MSSHTQIIKVVLSSSEEIQSLVFSLLFPLPLLRLLRLLGPSKDCTESRRMQLTINHKLINTKRLLVSIVKFFSLNAKKSERKVVLKVFSLPGPAKKKNKGKPPGVEYNGDWVTDHLKRVVSSTGYPSAVFVLV